MTELAHGRSKWQNRILKHGMRPASEFLVSPWNWRIHPQAQQDALAGVLSEVGWVQSVIVSARSGNLIDGHARVMLALKQGDDTPVPFVEVDVSEEEEQLILSALDPLAAMAVADKAKLDELLREVSSSDGAVQAMLAELAKASGIVPSDDDFAAAIGALPDGEKAPFQQMTFTVTDQQAERVKGALKAAKGQGGLGGTGNENSNGNALAAICEAYLVG